LEASEIFALLGPSGCGKSTLLALIAGLETPETGDLRWQDQSLARVPAHRRGFGLMFQDYLLFPHQNVAQNVGFGLKMQGQPKAKVTAGVEEALRLVSMEGFESRDVNTLSGGEQQRVALARALAPRPRLLMLDEPLGALDRPLRERLLEELRLILRRLKQTAIYVTHDQEEAFAIADRVAIMQAGRLVQVGAPAEVYAHPASRFVAEFLGFKNILQGQVRPKGQETVVVTEIGEIKISPTDTQLRVSQVAQILLRPDGATVADEGAFEIAGRLIEKSFRGSRALARIEASGLLLTFEFPSSQALPEVGERLPLRLKPDAVHFLA
jgi:ABC-type Fe3+/spermidine/putrescine transport system ATPase subunit